MTKPSPGTSGATTPKNGATNAANKARSPFAGTWTGTFNAKRQKVTVPKGTPYKSWKEDPGGATGDGTLTIEVADDGTISGNAEGALGKLRVAGMVEGTAEKGAVSAGLTPSDPHAPTAMTGVLTGTAKGDTMDVELQASNGDASVVRQAKTRLKRAKK